VRYHVSPAREHDSRHLTIDESWRGCGLLADLAYVSLDRLRACNAHDVRVVICLQDNWKPKVDSMARGKVTQECVPGTALEALLEEELRVLDGRAIAADVQVGGAKRPLHLRRVGVHTPTGDGFFLTNLPPRIGPRQVAARYRVRWEVERSIRLDTSVPSAGRDRRRAAMLSDDAPAGLARGLAHRCPPRPYAPSEDSPDAG
jgi:hypothetical protein